MERFFLPDFHSDSSVEFDLSSNESHHALHVLRLKHGDEIEVFDGQGKLARAEISKVARKTIRLRILERLNVENSLPAVAITLATAVPKGDRFRWLVEKATELGVTRLIPLMTTRSVVDPGQKKIQKLEQTVVAACKQSGRLHLLKIEEPVLFTNLVQSCDDMHAVLVADPSGRSLQEFHSENRKQNPFSEVTVIIGPEGGLTEEELNMAVHHGAESVSLGSNILRIETAAIAFCARLLLG